MQGAVSWVVVECPQGKIVRESLEALSVGLSFQKQYSMETAVLWAGRRPDDAQLAYLASLDVRRMLLLEGTEDAGEAALLAGLKELYLERKPQVVLFGAGPLSLALAPGLAALLNVGYVAGVTNLRRIGDTLSLTRPRMQGALSEVLRFFPPTHGLVSLYPRAFDVPGPAKGRPAGQLVQEIHPLREPEHTSGRVEVIERSLEPAEALELEDAEIVVAGGKGMQSEADFALLHDLARSLGGAVAASRIAVDLGWAPKERLVGQTGKKLFPELYIACGISGAHQHQAGMKDARHILAVNTDPQAPIFRIATWGILGDAPQVVREMVGSLKKTKDQGSGTRDQGSGL